MMLAPCLVAGGQTGKKHMADIQTAAPTQPDALLADLRALIDTARQRVAGAANAALTMLY